jgi:hypothetical protein
VRCKRRSGAVAHRYRIGSATWTEATGQPTGGDATFLIVRQGIRLEHDLDGHRWRLWHSCDRTLRVGWFQVRIGSWLVRRMVGGPSPPGDDGLSVGDPAQRNELPEGPMRGLPSALG